MDENSLDSLGRQILDQLKEMGNKLERQAHAAEQIQATPSTSTANKSADEMVKRLKELGVSSARVKNNTGGADKVNVDKLVPLFAKKMDAQNRAVIEETKKGHEKLVRAAEKQSVKVGASHQYNRYYRGFTGQAHRQFPRAHEAKYMPLKIQRDSVDLRRRLAGSGDQLRRAGAWARAKGYGRVGQGLFGAGGALGRTAMGAGVLGGFLKAMSGPLGIAASALIEAGKLLIKGAKALHDMVGKAVAQSQSVAWMRGAQGGEHLGYKSMLDSKNFVWEQMQASKNWEYRQRRMGFSSEEAAANRTQAAKLGLGYELGMQVGVISRKYGVSGGGELAQTLLRRSGNENYGKFMERFAAITNRTGQSLDELTNASNELFSSFKGGNVNAGFMQGLVAKWSEALAKGKAKMGDITSAYFGGQNKEGAQLYAQVAFAEKGGYQFRNPDMMGRAYELKTAGEGEQVKILRAGIKGILGTRGMEGFNGTDAQLGLAREMLRQLNPDLQGLLTGKNMRENINQILTDNISPELQKEMDKAMISNAEEQLQALNKLVNPLQDISLIVKAWAVRRLLPGDAEFSEFRKQTEDKLRETYKNENIITISNNTDGKAKVSVYTVAGSKESTGGVIEGF